MAHTVQDETSFFKEAEELAPAAIPGFRRLYDLRTEPGISVEFGTGKKGQRINIFIRKLSSAALLLVGADGQIEVQFDTNRAHEKGLRALEHMIGSILGRRLGSGWERTKPYLSMVEWVPKSRALAAYLRDLGREAASGARDEEPSDEAPASSTSAPAATLPEPTSAPTAPTVGSAPAIEAPPSASIGAEAYQPTSDPDELERRVAQLLSSHAELDPKGNAAPRRIATGGATAFERDPAVKARVLQLAAGYCEACGVAAPFQTADGRAFLEVHHVRPLAEQGPDWVSNTVALCPNCHRALHHAADADARRQALYGRVGRLVRAAPSPQD